MSLIVSEPHLAPASDRKLSEDGGTWLACNLIFRHAKQFTITVSYRAVLYDGKR